MKSLLERLDKIQYIGLRIRAPKDLQEGYILKYDNDPETFLINKIGYDRFQWIIMGTNEIHDTSLSGYFQGAVVVDVQ